MAIQSFIRRRTLATLAAAGVICAGITIAGAAPASAGEPGECTEPLCGVVSNEGTTPIGIFNNWDRPVPGYPDTENWNRYAQRHPDTAAAIWDYWSAHVAPDGMTAKLLPGRTDSRALGSRFHDTDGFYIGPGMRAIVDVGNVSHTCVIGPSYYKVSSEWPTVHVYSGPSVC